MIKRFIFYFGCALLLFLSVFTVYKVYKPEVISDDADIRFSITNKLKPDELLEELRLLEADKTLAVCFYEKNDISCKFFFDSVLQIIKDNYSLTRFDNLYFVNISLLSDAEKAEFKNKYKFTAVPCMSILKIENADICEIASIENNGIDQIGSVSFVEKFMIENGVIANP